MAFLKGVRRAGAVVINTPVDFQKRVRMPEEFDRKRFYVDANNGSDDNGGVSWSGAKATIQAAVDLGNALDYATENVDIYVANGQYEETVEIKWAALGMTAAQNTAALLWTNMGLNCGKLGTLRIIGTSGVFGAGHIKWTCGVGATQPLLYIGRPNVEIHNFNMQNDSGGVAAGAWGDGDEMSGHAQIAMPSIVAEDEYNDAALVAGAGNNVLIQNCRINSGGILNSGAKWVQVYNCHLEYCGYGVAMIANSKGRASESIIKNCTFSANTYDIQHGYAVTCWVDGCQFVSELSTYHLYPLAAHAASTYCTMSNCQGETEDKFTGGDAAKNSGWNALGITTTDIGYISSSANMAAKTNFLP